MNYPSADSEGRISPVVRGFLWLAVSYFCGTFFFTSSKYLLNNMSRADFFCWWYGSAMFFHVFYGVSRESISFADIGRKYLRLLSLYVFLDLTGTYAFFAAVRMMDPSISSFLNQSQIIFTLLLGFLILKEALSRGEVFAAVIIIIGVFVMTYNSGSVPIAGTVCMIFANITSAANFVIVRKIGSQVGSLTFARIRTTLLFIIFLSYNLYVSGKVAVPPAPVLIVTFAGSFFGPFLNIIAIYRSLEYFPAGKLALFRSLQPLFVMAAAGVILKTFPGFRETMGGLIIIIGCILLAYLHASYLMGLKRPVRSLR